MRHVFTTREKVLLVILAVLVIAVGYWKLILTPINDSIADLNAQTASEQDAILTNSARLSRMRQMQQELETPTDCFLVRTDVWKACVPSGCWWS